MKRILIGAVLATALTACGDGNPFVTTTGGGTPDPGDSSVPDALQSDLGTFTYDPATQTLTISGLSLDAEPLSGTYTRQPGLDRAGYEAYTTQESPLDRHSTAYVREIDGTRAVVVATGGQFGRYFRGSLYSRSGAYDPPVITPTTGLASYAGQYVGLINGTLGDNGDLLPLPPGSFPRTDPNAPQQAAEITGDILINADFVDNQVNGGITNRSFPDDGTITPEFVELAPTTIEADGSFTGDASQDAQTRGTYGGIFGGTGARVVAGSVFLEDHISQLNNEEETGIFVLVQCGTPGASPLCD